MISVAFHGFGSLQFCSSKLRWILDDDGPFQGTTQNPKRRRPSWAEDWWYFHHHFLTFICMNVFPQPIVSKPKISSCSVTNFEDMSNICLSMRSAVFTMEFWLFSKFFPMKTADSIVSVTHILQIIECSSPSSATLEIVFCLLRTWSFTRFTNDIIKSPWSVMKWFSVPHGLPGSVEKNFFVNKSNFSYHSPRILSGRPDRSYVVVSVFHSWEDQARS